MADKGLFTEEKEEKPKEEKNKFFQKTKGKVALINKAKGKIIVDVNGNGQETQYIEEKHANLKIGDSIEF